MEALKLTRTDYAEALAQVTAAAFDDTTYLDKFEVTFPAGINTANSLEICRIISDPSLEAKVHLMRVCIAGKNVEVKCPNGDVERFCISNEMDALEAVPLFRKEPLALMAISDAIYGYVVKKSIRLSKAQEAAEEHQD